MEDTIWHTSVWALEYVKYWPSRFGRRQRSRSDFPSQIKSYIIMKKNRMKETKCFLSILNFHISNSEAIEKASKSQKSSRKAQTGDDGRGGAANQKKSKQRWNPVKFFKDKVQSPWALEQKSELSLGICRNQWSFWDIELLCKFWI